MTVVYSVRWACGACVVHQTVSLPLTASWSAIAPQVSIGAGCERGNSMSCSTTTSARANAAAVAAASPDSQSKTWLAGAPSALSRSSRITGASGSSARRASTTASSGSYSTSISSSASRAE